VRLSSLADYAVVMMSAAARGHGASSASGRLSAAALAAETGVPLPTAQKLLGRLAAAGLLESARGSTGGVRLARPPAAISLAEIVEAVEGPIALTPCAEHGAHDCGLDHQCHVRPHWDVVNRAVRQALADVSLARLSRAPEAAARSKVHA